jgi:hypothetical protein
MNMPGQKKANPLKDFEQVFGEWWTPIAICLYQLQPAVYASAEIPLTRKTFNAIKLLKISQSQAEDSQTGVQDQASKVQQFAI